MSTRDDLVDLIQLCAVTKHSFGKIADAILKAGWRPPMRTVTTVEELEKLPEGTMIVTGPDEDGDWHQFIAQDNARYPRSWVGLHVERFSRNLVRLYDGPYRVVWEPEAKA